MKGGATLVRYRGEELDAMAPEEVEAIADKLATALSKATVRQVNYSGIGVIYPCFNGHCEASQCRYVSNEWKFADTLTMTVFPRVI